MSAPPPSAGDPRQEDADGVWSVGTAIEDERPVIVRFRRSFPTFVRREEFATMFALVWPYGIDDDHHGMPDPELRDQLVELEDLLTPALEDARLACLAAVITGNGMCEWMWYVRDADAVVDAINVALALKPPLPIQLHFDADPDWDHFASFEALGDDESSEPSTSA